jgi:hypothetical protein
MLFLSCLTLLWAHIDFIKKPSTGFFLHPIAAILIPRIHIPAVSAAVGGESNTTRPVSTF